MNSLTLLAGGSGVVLGTYSSLRFILLSVAEVIVGLLPPSE